jgi:hypothetical protein
MQVSEGNRLIYYYIGGTISNVDETTNTCTLTIGAATDSIKKVKVGDFMWIQGTDDYGITNSNILLGYVSAKDTATGEISISNTCHSLVEGSSVTVIGIYRSKRILNAYLLGDATSGSKYIENVIGESNASLSANLVGQTIISPYFPDGTYIDSVGTSTIKTSNPSTATKSKIEVLSEWWNTTQWGSIDMPVSTEIGYRVGDVIWNTDKTTYPDVLYWDVIDYGITNTAYPPSFRAFDTASSSAGGITEISAGWGATALPDPITATGFVGVDSGLVTSRVWHQKSVDSLSVALASFNNTEGVKIMNYLGDGIKHTALGFPRTSIVGSTALTDGRAHYMSVWVEKGSSITGVEWYQTVAGNYTADNYNGVGLYSINTSTGLLTLEASSTDDGNIWKGASGAYYRKAFTTPFTTADKTVYYIAFIYNQSAVTTAPSLSTYFTVQGAAMGSTFMSNSQKIAGYSTTATLPATIASSSLTVGSGSQAWYLGLY